MYREYSTDTHLDKIYSNFYPSTELLMHAEVIFLMMIKALPWRYMINLMISLHQMALEFFHFNEIYL